MVVLAMTGVLMCAATALAVPVTFSAETPTGDIPATTLRPTISVRVQDPQGVPLPTSFKVDGVTRTAKVVYDKLPSGLNDVTKATYSWTPTSNLALGAHRVEVRVRGTDGINYTTTWSFNIGLVPPRLVEPVPVSGSVVTDKTPMISAKVAEFRSSITGHVVTIDDVQVPSTYDPSTGIVKPTTNWLLTDGSIHDVTIAVTNDAGSASLSWSFVVDSGAVGVGPSTCVTCHSEYPMAHPVDNCALCHSGAGSPIGGDYSNPIDGHGAGSTCAQCHGDLSDCTRCHNETYPAIPSHDLFNDTFHKSQGIATSCLGSSCHNERLSKEHLSRKDEGGALYTCATCHANADERVANAVASGDTACGACHDDILHGTRTNEAACAECHVVTAAGWEGSAHESVTKNVVITKGNNARCEACHDHNSSEVNKVSYRYGAATLANAQEALCFECHSLDGADATKPNTWNGRDVKAQFTKTSSHALATVGISHIEDTEQVAFAQTSSGDFNAAPWQNNVQVTNTAGGEVRLARNYDPAYTVDPPTAVFAMVEGAGGAATIDQFLPEENAWNSDNSGFFDPVDLSFSPGGGNNFYVISNVLHLARGGSLENWKYNPPTTSTPDAWLRTFDMPALGGNTGDGSDVAVNAGAAVVYVSRGNNQSALGWRAYDDNTSGVFNFRVSGTNRLLGRDSGLAYAPDADRLFTIWSNTSSGNFGDGKLYWRSAPGRTTTTVDWTAGPQLGPSGVSVSGRGRLAYAKVNGVEYLFHMGYGPSNTPVFQVVSNLGGTPVMTDLTAKRPTTGGVPWADYQEGCDLEYNPADGYLYAIRGSGTTGFARIQVPTDPTNPAAWSSWQELSTGGRTWTNRSTIAFVAIDPPPYLPFRYHEAGSFGQQEIEPTPGSTKWGKVSWTADTPLSTSLSVKVEGLEGADWVDLAVSSVSPIDLSAYTTAAYPRIRLTALLFTTNPTNADASPVLNDWKVTSTKPVLVYDNSTMTCASCHEAHSVKRGSGAWDVARVSDPTDTRSGVASIQAFCLKCHTGEGAMIAASQSPLVPYAVQFRTVFGPFFGGWGKDAFLAAGHASAISCQNCHDPHGSDNPSLIAYTSRDGSIVRDNSVTVNEEGLCYKCHGTGSGADMDVQGPQSSTYGHPTDDRSGQHANTEGYSDLTVRRHAECADCHDSHAAKRGNRVAGTSVAAPAVTGAVGVRPSAWGGNFVAPAADEWVEETLDGQSTDYEAYLCFKCHAGKGKASGPVTTPSGTYTPTDVAQEFNPGNFSYHNVLGSAVGMQSVFSFIDTGGVPQTRTWAVPTVSVFKAGTGMGPNAMLACSDCHTGGSASQAKGPHGSSVKWMLDPAYPVDWKQMYLTSNTTNGTGMAVIGGNAATPAQSICAKCHDLFTSGTGVNGFSNTAHGDSHHRDQTNGRGDCVACHIGVPHGWKRPRLLVYATDPAPYKAPTRGGALAGIRSSTDHTLSSGAAVWQQSDCAQTGCGGHGSGPAANQRIP